MIKEYHMPALQGMFPSWITSCSSDGEPNTTVISQIWYVDEKHVALSFQFFNKTKKNISENPYSIKLASINGCKDSFVLNFLSNLFI